MKSKKGFMLGEYTLKTIIAVLCILLLMYLLFSLYSNNKDQRNLQLAEASLNELVGKMGEAKESGSAEVTLLAPSKWRIYGFNFYDNYKPENCLKNCVCICKPLLSGGIAKECEAGICEEIEENIKFIGEPYKVFGNFKITYETIKPPGLNYENKGFKIEELK